MDISGSSLRKSEAPACVYSTALRSRVALIPEILTKPPKFGSTTSPQPGRRWSPPPCHAKFVVIHVKNNLTKTLMFHKSGSIYTKKFVDARMPATMYIDSLVRSISKFTLPKT